MSNDLQAAPHEATADGMTKAIENAWKALEHKLKTSDAQILVISEVVATLLSDAPNETLTKVTNRLLASKELNETTKENLEAVKVWLAEINRIILRAR